MKKYLIALALVGLTTTSCYEKLNIAPPNAITNEQVMELLRTADDATVVTIMGALADALPAQLKGGGYSTFNNQYEYNYQGQDCLRNMTGNDIVMGGTQLSGDAENFYEGVNLRGTEVNSNPAWWTRGYAMVHAANKVFNLLTDELVEANGSAKLKEYQGRAYTLRAAAYLYLMECYGNGTLGVPLYYKYDVGQALQARSTSAATFDSIVIWAQKGVSLLTAGGVGYTDAEHTGPINLGVANYVLARAALLGGKYATAISACDAIIPNYSLMTEAQYVTVGETTTIGGKNYPVFYADNSGFSNIKKNPEAILGWTNALKAYGTHNYWMNFFNSGQQSRIDTRLYNKIDDNDYRKANFNATALGEIITPGPSSFVDGSTFEINTYSNYKFVSNVGLNGAIGSSTATNSGQVDFAQYRLSEIYLMKAEAQAQSGGDAKGTLNILLAARTKAGAATLTCDTYNGMAGLTALEMVQLQSRIELWGEGGREWYNNKRWGINVNRASSLHWNQAMTYSAADMVLQIPIQEMNTNNLCVQNN